MKFQGAVVKEQGVTFAIVIVKMNVIENTVEREKAINLFSPIFPSMPVILMAQNSQGFPKYYGREDIVKFLTKILITQIPWKEYTI